MIENQTRLLYVNENPFQSLKSKTINQKRQLQKDEKLRVYLILRLTNYI
jgi:hypothetical protein